MRKAIAREVADTKSYTMLHCNMACRAYMVARISKRSVLSKQLALSAAFSVFAMAAFVLASTGDVRNERAETLAGAKVEAPAPALIRIAPAISN